MAILTILLVALGAVLFLPTLSDTAMLLVARRRGRNGPDRSRSMEDRPLPRILYLVPAHDEELLLGRCLRSLAELRYPSDRFGVIVIADNCRDDTAGVARRYRVTCLERRDEMRRGKPWALAWALERIDLDQYDAVVVLDADSLLDPEHARELARLEPLDEKAIQGYNGVSNAADSSLTRMAAVFSAARCLHMNELKARSGTNVPLGNGLCIGVNVLRRWGWPAFSIVEDWELYARFTVLGVRIENAPRAGVFSQEARTMEQSSGQRKRWSAGKLQVLVEQAAPLIRSPSIGWLQKLDGVAELSAPGPVVHAAIAVLLTGAAVVARLPGTAGLVVLLGIPVLRLGVYAVLGLGDVEAPVRAVTAFLTLPAYATWRLGLQISALSPRGPRSWARTPRHREAGADHEPAGEPIVGGGDVDGGHREALADGPGR